MPSETITTKRRLYIFISNLAADTYYSIFLNCLCNNIVVRYFILRTNCHNSDVTYVAAYLSHKANFVAAAFRKYHCMYFATYICFSVSTNLCIEISNLTLKYQALKFLLRVI